MTNLEWLRTLSAEEIAPLLVHHKTIADDPDDDEVPFEYDVAYVPLLTNDDGERRLYLDDQDAVDIVIKWLMSDRR